MTDGLCLSQIRTMTSVKTLQTMMAKQRWNAAGRVRECQHCDEAGPLKDMQEHVLKEHTPEGYHPYRCVACVEDFSGRVDLLDHIKKAHPKAECESLMTSKIAIDWDVHLNTLSHEQSISFYGKEFQLPTPGTEPMTPEKPELPTEEMSHSPKQENSVEEPPTIEKLPTIEKPPITLKLKSKSKSREERSESPSKARTAKKSKKSAKKSRERSSGGKSVSPDKEKSGKKAKKSKSRSRAERSVSPAQNGMLKLKIKLEKASPPPSPPMDTPPDPLVPTPEEKLPSPEKSPLAEKSSLPTVLTPGDKPPPPQRRPMKDRLSMPSEGPKTTQPTLEGLELHAPSPEKVASELGLPSDSDVAKVSNTECVRCSNMQTIIEKAVKSALEKADRQESGELKRQVECLTDSVDKLSKRVEVLVETREGSSSRYDHLDDHRDDRLGTSVVVGAASAQTAEAKIK